MFEKLRVESRTWDSDELMDIAEAIAETAKPRIPARVSIIEADVVRHVYATYYWLNETYEIDREVVETYRLG